jgi:phage N-6-adenine-methyltransferase
MSGFPNTSVSERWGTPQWLFDVLDQEFRFTLDAAADWTNTKCPRFFGAQDPRTHRGAVGLAFSLNPDALSMPHWVYDKPEGGVPAVWCNPPYSKKNGGILPWMVRGLATARSGAVCVMLIYARTDTKAWSLCHRYAHEIRLITGRLKFNPPPDYNGVATAAGAPSAIIVFRPETAWVGRSGGAAYRMMDKP